MLSLYLLICESSINLVEYVTLFPRLCTGYVRALTRGWTLFFVSEIKRDLKRILMYECRCNERLKAKSERSTRLN